ncbi:MAG: peroxiredoxin [Qipengyuania sp.]|nr:peroxiredoxin [Qipengyuania sp.]
MTERPGVGDTMPDIALETVSGGTLRPGDFAGRRAVLFFYSKDMTPGCTTEATDFSALKPRFDKAGVVLLGISKDSPDRHRTFMEKHALAVDLASDAAEGGLSDALGIWTEKHRHPVQRDAQVRTRKAVAVDTPGLFCPRSSYRPVDRRPVRRCPGRACKQEAGESQSDCLRQHS